MAWLKRGFPPINSSKLYVGSDKEEHCLTAMGFEPATFGVLAQRPHRLKLHGLRSNFGEGVVFILLRVVGNP